MCGGRSGGRRARAVVRHARRLPRHHRGARRRGGVGALAESRAPTHPCAEGDLGPGRTEGDARSLGQEVRRPGIDDVFHPLEIGPELVVGRSRGPVLRVGSRLIIGPDAFGAARCPDIGVIARRLVRRQLVDDPQFHIPIRIEGEVPRLVEAVLGCPERLEPNAVKGMLSIAEHGDALCAENRLGAAERRRHDDRNRQDQRRGSPWRCAPPRRQRRALGRTRMLMMMHDNLTSLCLFGSGRPVHPAREPRQGFTVVRHRGRHHSRCGLFIRDFPDTDIPQMTHETAVIPTALKPHATIWHGLVGTVRTDRLSGDRKPTPTTIWHLGHLAPRPSGR